MIKYVSWFIVLVLAFSLIACEHEPKIQFEKPQPENEKNLTKFKKRFQGTYINLSDSSLLTISENEIIKDWYYIYELPQSHLDTIKTLEIQEDRIITPDYPEGLPIQRKGDTIIIKEAGTKNIFTFSEKTVLRYFKGNYFLNTKASNELWNVRMMNLNRKGELTFKSFSGSKEELDALSAITRLDTITDEDGKTLKYSIKPTKREIKALLREPLFNSGEVFKKIKAIPKD